MTQAALYLRISQDATGEALGVTRQREDCEALAHTAGWTVAETYVDNDISAYKDRPAYNRMLNDIRAGKIEAVIAWAPDRLYRRIKDLETLIELLEVHKIEIRTVKAGDLDLSGAYGRMLARILGAIAAGEGEIKSERWRRSWLQRREAGEFAKNGRRCFGYTLDGELIPDEAEVAQWMAERILAGTPILTLARELEALNICTSYGNAWTPAQVKRYLLNPRIAGWATIHGRLVAEGAWTPLIDKETHEGLKALLNSRHRPYVPRVALINGLLFCGAEGCGQRMVTSSAKGTRTYRCPKRPGMNGCGRVSGNAAPIEELVESYARTRLADPRVQARIAELRAEPESGLHSELAAIDMRIVELEKQLDDPSLSLDAILRAIDRARTRQVELQDRLAAQMPAHIPTDPNLWPDDLTSRRALIDLVVARIELRPATRTGRQGFDTGRMEIEPL